MYLLGWHQWDHFTVLLISIFRVNFIFPLALLHLIHHYLCHYWLLTKVEESTIVQSFMPEIKVSNACHSSSHMKTSHHLHWTFLISMQLFMVFEDTSTNVWSSIPLGDTTFNLQCHRDAPQSSKSFLHNSKSSRLSLHCSNFWIEWYNMYVSLQIGFFFVYEHTETPPNRSGMRMYYEQMVTITDYKSKYMSHVRVVSLIWI